MFQALFDQYFFCKCIVCTSVTNSVGYATRMCGTEGNWMQPNATDCANRAFEDLLRRVSL